MPSHSYVVAALQVILPLVAAALTVTVGRAMRGRGVSEWALSWYALAAAAAFSTIHRPPGGLVALAVNVAARLLEDTSGALQVCLLVVVTWMYVRECQSSPRARRWAGLIALGIAVGRMMVAGPASRINLVGLGRVGTHSAATAIALPAAAVWMLVNIRRATPATIVLAGVYIILGVTSVLKLLYMAGALSGLPAVTTGFVDMFDVARYALLGLAAALILVERLEVRLSTNESDAARAIEATERESEQRFRLIANTAPVMIWMSDVDRQLTYVNQRWLEFTGWPPNAAPGRRWLQLIHPDDVDRSGEVLAQAFDGREPFQVEHRLRRADGEYRWTVTAGVPRYGADAAFAGFVGTAVDVTDRKRVELALLDSHAALQERTVELERRTTQLRQMASDLTLAEQRARAALAKTLHDGLQQLLVVAAINVTSYVARETRRGLPADELVQAQKHLDEAIAAARSLSVELFPPALQTSGLPMALGWLADWAMSKYGLEVKVSADPRADSDRKDVRALLFESVRELLFNVVKHAQVDQVVVDLALGPNDTLCITVTDEGLGFDPAELDERATVNQAGWGLFSIRERLILLGGRFDIESARGRGTKFRLIAPRFVAPRDVAPRAAAATPNTLTILIADDQPALRKTFRELLEGRPELKVVGEAVNGVEAIAQARRLRPHVVLMDVSMPEMDGVEATRHIRSELPSVQVLGFSVYPRLEEAHPIEEAGAEGFFTKGVDTARLINHLLTKHASLSSEHFARSAHGPQGASIPSANPGL
jgi:PAS domain S-box-containing protein